MNNDQKMLFGMAFLVGAWFIHALNEVATKEFLAQLESRKQLILGRKEYLERIDANSDRIINS